MKDRRTQPRTHYIHKINYSAQERIVGAFVLVALAILVWLLFSSGKANNFFEENFVIYGKLQAAKAVNVDTEVRISGISAGTVTSVDITDNSNIVITMEVLRKYENLLRTDSVGKLTSFDLAVIGKSIIEITPGSPEKPYLTNGSTIEIIESVNLKNLMDKVAPTIASLEASITKVNQILTAIDVPQLEHSLANLHKISVDISDISEHMRAGNGLVGSALYDDAFEQKIKTSVNNMEQASIKVNAMLIKVEQQLNNMPELLEKALPLLKEADRTIKATQRIWPLSNAVEEKTEMHTLTPAAPAND